MNKTLFTIILILVLFTLFILFTVQTCKENFDNKYSSQELIDMFNSLEVAEKRCNEIEERQKLEENKDQLDKNEATFNELEELDKKINELKGIVRDLTIEKKKRDNINNKCQNQTQIKLNRNYKLLNELNNENLISDNKLNIDLNIPDNFKFNSQQHNPTQKAIKCNKKFNPNKHFKASDINKCYNCDVNKLNGIKNHINKDFN